MIPGDHRSSGLRRRRDGSSAVEFAFVGLPFFMMLFAIMEIGLVFVTDSVLDNATAETARLVRTGQAATSSMTPAQFKTELCNRMSIFSGDCPDRASIDVRSLTQFRNATPPDPMASGTSFDEGSLTYASGQPGDLMLVRVWYRHPLITPFLAQALSRLDDGNARLMATTAFRNEPYAPTTTP